MWHQVTPVILTHNEEANIGRTLSRLGKAKEVIVVDSASTDATRAILARHANVRVYVRAFDSHVAQWQFALTETAIATDWVLALDADYVLSNEVIDEIDGLSPPPDVGGYEAAFTYCIDGVPLRSGIYPPVTVLYKRKGARYVQEGHTQRIRTTGGIARLRARIFHDDRKPFSRWLETQRRYTRLEAQMLHRAPLGAVGLIGFLRRLLIVAPPAVLVHCLLLRGGILDGKAGIIYALQRAWAEALISANLLKAYLRLQRR